MYKRLLMAMLFAPLLCANVSSQEAGSLHSPIPPNNRSVSDARPAPTYQLKGVLISRFERSALVNGEILHVGDRMGGMEILAIDQDGVRVLTSARDFIINVGGTVAHSTQRQDRRVAHSAAPDQHAVKPGETLSGIALRYLQDGVTMNQMMVALFKSNPQAFDDNINVLHEGATLRIPNASELEHHAPETATAKVVQQTDRWQATKSRRTKNASFSRDPQYGPVKSGETLSGIAARMLHSGVTMNQMMIAMFQSNPQAFDDNINVLREGAILRIPDPDDLHWQTPATATAEVVRQTRVWQTRYEQHAQSKLAHTSIMASSDERVR